MARWAVIALMGAALGSVAGAAELLWLGLGRAGGLAQTSLWIAGSYALLGTVVALAAGGALRARVERPRLASVFVLAVASILVLGFALHWNDRPKQTPFVTIANLGAGLAFIALWIVVVRWAKPSEESLAPLAKWALCCGGALALVFAVLATETLRELRALEAGQQLQLIEQSGRWGRPAAALHASSVIETTARREPDLLFIGIDGATWGIMGPLVEQGRLPNIAKLMSRGVAGVLRSEDPMDSPVVWTSILTGKTPDRHGIDAWESATSANRRARALWSILAERGDRTLVVNVPGTFPAEDPGEGVFLAGFPNRLESYTNIGVVHTTRPAGDFHWSPQELIVAGEPGSRTGVLEVRDQSTLELGSALGIAHRALTHREVPMLGGRAFRRYASLPFREALNREVPNEDDSVGVELELAGRSLRLGAGEWSPWIGLELAGEPFAFRLRVLEQGEHLSLYVSPLFLTGTDQRFVPEERGEALQEALGPYVIEGMGVAVMEEPRVLEALAEHLFGVARDRFRFVERLVSEEDFDAIVTIFTLTDRIQHAFWGFLDADSLPEIGDPVPYPNTSAEVDREIDRSLLAALIPAAYEMADAVVGRLVERVGDQTLIVLASDHGFESAAHRIPGFGAHGSAGIYLFAGGPLQGRAGPPIAAGPELRLYDLVPTIEAALGVPVAQDLDGEVAGFVREALESRGRIIATTDSHERPGEHDTGAESIDATMKGQLESLGYIE